MKNSFKKRLDDLLVKRFGGNKTAFAKAAGIKTPTLTNYIDGEYFPKVPEIESIARAAGVSVHWLFTGEELPSWFGGVADAGGVYRAGEAKNCNPFLTQIIGWIDEIFGENSPQSVIFYNDLRDRYPSFADYVRRTTPPPEDPENKKEQYCPAAGD